MAGYSLNVQPEQMLYWKSFAEDNICSLIINVKPKLQMSRDLVSIALSSALLLQILMLAVVLDFLLEGLTADYGEPNSNKWSMF